MENIEQKLNEIHFLLASNIEQMNKFVKEANDPEKRQKEAQILIETAKSINSTTEAMKGLISSEKALIENFKPEVKHTQTTLSLTVNNPLGWVIGAIAAILISFAASYWMYSKWQDEKTLTEQYKQESGLKDWNYMKYKYLEMFGEPQLSSYLKAFDKEYEKNWKEMDKKIRKRERLDEEAAQAKRDAEFKAAEAKKAQAVADSLQNAR